MDDHIQVSSDSEEDTDFDSNLKIMIIWKGSKSHSTVMLWQVPPS